MTESIGLRSSAAPWMGSTDRIPDHDQLVSGDRPRLACSPHALCLGEQTGSAAGPFYTDHAHFSMRLAADPLAVKKSLSSPAA